MAKNHENYKHLIWTLARTDFTLRYHGSVLGYVWALLKPMLTFAILYFVFSSIFNPKNSGQDYYAIQLLLGIILFTFFAEGSGNSMSSLLSKAQLVTKIYVPRWTLILSATINAAMLFGMNIIILVVLFAINRFVPSLGAIALLLLFVIMIYVLIVAFGLLTAPLFIRFRDLSMIWEVIVTGLFYATPIIYPLTLLPENMRQIMLLNPLGFIVHFSNQAIILNHFPDPWQLLLFVVICFVLLGIGILSYRHNSKRIAEYI